MLFFKQIKGVQTFIKASVLKCTFPGTAHAKLDKLSKYKEIIPMTAVWFFFPCIFEIGILFTKQFWFFYDSETFTSGGFMQTMAKKLSLSKWMQMACVMAWS